MGSLMPRGSVGLVQRYTASAVLLLRRMLGAHLHVRAEPPYDSIIRECGLLCVPTPMLHVQLAAACSGNDCLRDKRCPQFFFLAAF